MNKKKLSIIVISAALLLGISSWYLSDFLHKNANGQAAYDHTAAILKIGPRTVGSAGLKKAQDYISKELAKHGWTTVTQKVERNTPVGKRTFSNLIARYQAPEIKTIHDALNIPAKGILSAHLDSKKIAGTPDFLGADDAASACALMIQLAKTLAEENPKLAKDLELVFFDGEEAFNEQMDMSIGDGLYGSRAYAITLYTRVPKPQFGIVLDMVGHKNLQIEVPGDTPSHLYNSMTRAAEKHGYSKHFGQLKPNQYNPEGAIYDDHFFLNKAGVPTIDIIGANFSDTHWWHQKGDTIENISPESLEISYQVTLEMLRDLLK